jgi:hypothetical protein
MRKEIAIQIEIDAPPALIWSILTDFPGFQQRYASVYGTDGPGAKNVRVHFRFDLPKRFRDRGKVALIWRALRRTGVFLRKRIIRTEHYFELTALPNGRTRFSHGEIVGGTLARIAWPILRISGRMVHQQLGIDVKRKAEGEMARLTRKLAQSAAHA